MSLTGDRPIPENPLRQISRCLSGLNHNAFLRDPGHYCCRAEFEGRNADPAAELRRFAGQGRLVV